MHEVVILAENMTLGQGEATQELKEGCPTAVAFLGAKGHLLDSGALHSVARLRLRERLEQGGQ